MAPLGRLLSLGLLCSFYTTTFCLDTVDGGEQESGTFTGETAEFQKLLSDVDSSSLHAALHDFSPKKFQHGMFKEDRAAVEAIHKEEPKVANGIVKMANLVKRQDNGTTPVIGTSSSPLPAPAPLTTTSPPPPSSAAVAPVSTTLLTSSTPAPAAISTTPTTSSSTTMPPSMTQGQVITSTDAAGYVVVSTVGGGMVTLSRTGIMPSSTTSPVSSAGSTLVQTSTLPDGSQSTITAVTVVGANGGSGKATGTSGSGSTGTGSGQPGLQTAEAAMTRSIGKEMALVLGAAMGVALLL